MRARTHRITLSRHRWRLCVAIALTAAQCALLASCRSQTRRTPDDTIVVLLEQALTSADPRYPQHALDGKLNKLVTRGLTVLDPETLEPKLDLAEAIEPISPTVVRVRLRPALTFSNGRQLRAQDVAYTFQSVLAPGSDSPLAKRLRDKFVAVEVEDARHVRVVLQRPLATLWSDLEFGIVSELDADATGHFGGGQVVGAGPYRILGFDTQRVRLARNERFAGTPPRVAEVELRFVTAEPARALMLAGGSADLVQNAVQLDLVGELARSPRLEVVSGPSVITTYLMPNLRTPRLRDVRVRQAIAHALDREALVRAKLAGLARLANGFIAPSHWAWASDARSYSHDRARAKELLDQAGFPDPDGDGPAVRFSLTYKVSTNQFRAALAAVIASQLRAVGIGVEVQRFEFATLLADLKAGRFELSSLQTAEITDPDYLYIYFHSSQIPTPQAPDGLNRWGYENPAVDALLAEGRQELDRSRRTELYRHAQRQLAEDLPVIPLWHEDNVAVVNSGLRGYRVTAHARFGGLVEAEK